MAREAPTPSTLGASPLDLTSRYDAAAYRRGPRERWMLDRVREPVRALVLHHAGGVLRSGPTVRLRDAWRERSARLEACERSARLEGLPPPSTVRRDVRGAGSGCPAISIDVSRALSSCTRGSPSNATERCPPGRGTLG